MYCDPILWKSVRDCVFESGMSRRSAARKFRLSRNTIRKMLLSERPPSALKRTCLRPVIGPHEPTIRRMVEQRSKSGYNYLPRIRDIFDYISRAENYDGSYSAVRNYVSLMKDGPVPAAISAETWQYSSNVLLSIGHQKSALFLKAMAHGRQPVLSEAKVKSFARKAMGYQRKNLPSAEKPFSHDKAERWLHSIAAGAINTDAIALSVGSVEDFGDLLQIVACSNPIKRKRALTILGTKAGFSIRSIAAALKISRISCAKYSALYKELGAEGLVQSRRATNRRYDDPTLKKVVFTLIHEPPSNYDINRTTWRMEDFRSVLGKRGHTASPQVLRKILKDAGYRWRKAKVVLTSRDPEYSAKLQVIQEILANLKEDEAFFSIDEFGPFAVKMKGGRSLVGPGIEPVVPQWQKSKGCLIMTAALELSTNQITHFYSKKKNTAEMIKLMDILVNQYPDQKRIFLSWDAASWHISKDLNLHIKHHNSINGPSGLPEVLVAPLPSGAQFLNVIESVFSGMARAIIHNSNYDSADDAKAAIDRYFKERNAKFIQSPSRAGKKIWGCEPELPVFSPSSNCKDPRYR